jgi:hypothetical protein
VKELLDDIEYVSGKSLNASYCNEDYYKIIEDCKLLKFDYLFPQIIIYLYDNGILTEKMEWNINLLKNYLYLINNSHKTDNQEDSEYHNYVVGFYSKINFSSRYLVRKIAYKLMMKMLEVNNNIILYNVDTIFYTGEYISLPYGKEIEYHSEDINFLYIVSQSNYVYYTNMIHWNIYNSDNNALSQIKYAIRNKKLKLLLE